MNEIELSVALAVVMSLFFSYVPGASTWYKNLGVAKDDNGTRKRLVMLGFLVLTSGAAYGLACTSWGEGLNISLSCDQAGWTEALTALVAAAIANQSVYGLSPRKSPGPSG